MEFNQKLQELRKTKGITQEELSSALYVSRTAVSKWESGRGYPNIDSLKAIAKYFGITVDELLSSDELLIIAAKDSKEKERRRRDLVFGLLDISAIMLLFLPFFGEEVEEIFRSVSLIMLTGISPYLKIAYISLVAALSAFGVVTLALQSCQGRAWTQSKGKISLILSAVLLLLFTLSRQPYAAALIFIFLAIKALMLIRWR